MMNIGDWLGQGTAQQMDPRQQWIARHPEFGGNFPGFQHGMSMGQMLQLLPHHGARYLNRPEGVQQAGSFHNAAFGQFR